MTDQQPPQRTADELAAVLDERLGRDKWALARSGRHWAYVWYVWRDGEHKGHGRHSTIHAALLAAVKWLERGGS